MFPPIFKPITGPWAPFLTHRHSLQFSPEWIMGRPGLALAGVTPWVGEPSGRCFQLPHTLTQGSHTPGLAHTRPSRPGSGGHCDGRAEEGHMPSLFLPPCPAEPSPAASTAAWPTPLDPGTQHLGPLWRSLMAQSLLQQHPHWWEDEQCRARRSCPGGGSRGPGWA